MSDTIKDAYLMLRNARISLEQGDLALGERYLPALLAEIDFFRHAMNSQGGSGAVHSRSMSLKGDSAVEAALLDRGATADTPLADWEARDLSLDLLRKEGFSAYHSRMYAMLIVPEFLLEPLSIAKVKDEVARAVNGTMHLTPMRSIQELREYLATRRQVKLGLVEARDRIQDLARQHDRIWSDGFTGAEVRAYGDKLFPASV